jgi:hypothetical protein
METARDIPRNESACVLHQDDDRPYRAKALYAETQLLRILSCMGLCEFTHHLIESDDPDYFLSV